MNRRAFLRGANLAGLAVGLPSTAAFAAKADDSERSSHANTSATKSGTPETLLLKDYRPKSIYKIPVTQIPKAKFPIIDMHSHPYVKTEREIDDWVRNMDEVGVERTTILTMTTGAEFDDIYKKYSKHPGRFEMWCGFDFVGFDKPGFGPAAVKELDGCRQGGGRGVGEVDVQG